MDFKLKAYDNERNYIEYFDEKTQKIYQRYTNADYFVFDITCKNFQEIMSGTGGFVANMTTRYIKENNLDTAEKIALCAIPGKFNDFTFYFAYLDKDENILAMEKDSCPLDYLYFKKKFSSCILEEGFIYELEARPRFKMLTDKIEKHPSLGFGFKIDEQDVKFGDTFVCENMGIFTEDMKETLKLLDAKDILFSFDTDMSNKVCFRGKIRDNEENILKNYQVRNDIKSKDEYIIKMKEKYKNFSEKDVDEDDFNFILSLSAVKEIADSIHLKQKKEEKEEKIEDDEIERQIE